MRSIRKPNIFTFNVGINKRQRTTVKQHNFKDVFLSKLSQLEHDEFKNCVVSETHISLCKKKSKKNSLRNAFCSIRPLQNVFG